MSVAESIPDRRGVRSEDGRKSWTGKKSVEPTTLPGICAVPSSIPAEAWPEVSLLMWIEGGRLDRHLRRWDQRQRHLAPVRANGWGLPRGVLLPKRGNCTSVREPIWKRWEGT